MIELSTTAPLSVHSFNYHSNRSTSVLPHYSSPERAQTVKQGDYQEERGRARKIQEEAPAERGGSLQGRGEVAALRLLQGCAGSNQDLEEYENDEVLVSEGLPQSMPFPLDHYNFELAGKPKGIKNMSKERGLPERG